MLCGNGITGFSLVSCHVFNMFLLFVPDMYYVQGCFICIILWVLLARWRVERILVWVTKGQAVPSLSKPSTYIYSVE